MSDMNNDSDGLVARVERALERKLQNPENLPTETLLKVLEPVIRKYLDIGFTYEYISKVLLEEGIKIAPFRLAQHFTGIRIKGGKRHAS